MLRTSTETSGISGVSAITRILGSQVLLQMSQVSSCDDKNPQARSLDALGRMEIRSSGAFYC